MEPVNDCSASPAEIFWGEMAPCEHVVQIYQDDAVFLDALEGFIHDGIRAGDGVIVIATPAHRAALERRLVSRGIPLTRAIARDQYISLDAEETLQRFMVIGPDGKLWPDDRRFEDLVDEVLALAGGRTAQDLRAFRVRAFGEMVAVLWARGHTGAVVRLEHLWHRFCREKGFSLFCAYPRIGFTDDPEASMRDICAAHSRVVPG